MLTMTKFGFLLILVLAKTLAEEHLDPMFRAIGGELEFGYCFGVDYVLLYKLTVDGKQLLGNSSNVAVVPPETYKGRISPTSILNQLLGMQVDNLKASDSGVYLRECWRDNTLVNHHKHLLYICDEEVSTEQIRLESDGGANLVCNASYSRGKHASIRWFREAQPGYETTLFLDTKRSLEPLLEELKDFLQVMDNGSSLHVSEEGLRISSHFYCLVMEGEQCKSFQNLQLPDNDADAHHAYHSEGERVVLPCLSEHSNDRQTFWKTPSGRVDSTALSTGEMYISKNEEAGDSLVIPSITPSHVGEYVCSNSLTAFFITVCPKMFSDEIQVSEGSEVTLDCVLPMTESVNILWYQQTESKKDHLIYDSADPSLNISLNMHIATTSLKITDLTQEDSGMYWCVVLQDDEYTGDSYPEDEPENSDVYDDDSDWLDENETDTCIGKTVIQLKVQSPDYEVASNPDTKANPESDSGTHLYAVIGGVVLGGLLIALIVGVVVMKLRAKRKATNQRRDESSPQQKETLVSEPLMNL